VDQQVDRFYGSSDFRSAVSRSEISRLWWFRQHVSSPEWRIHKVGVVLCLKYLSKLALSNKKKTLNGQQPEKPVFLASDDKIASWQHTSKLRFVSVTSSQQSRPN
jgi:hypothetical protein